MTTIYTLGYSGWSLDDIAAKVEELNAVLVDVRMVPRSRISFYNSGVLTKRFGDFSKDPANGRYVWLKEFGNRNYKGTYEQIEIVDFAAGAAKLAAIAAAGHSVILLCGCPDVNTCHRKLLAESLSQMWAARIVHARTPILQQQGGKQFGLFD